VGTFYAQYILFIDPVSTMALDLSILISLVAVLGGAGSFWGPLLGAFLLIPINELTRSFLGGGGRAYNLIIYGALIIAIAVWQPGGLWELLETWRKKRWTGARPKEEEVAHG
ncbi:MAG TPA: branched-chain amino acid ABC transporter permease, partial [Caldilineae bacterium]|nr:branched-chain amino acid ABC transporter permease [Caldilineae bacterium]